MTIRTAPAALAASFLILAPARELHAQDSTFARIDRYVAREMTRQHIPGVAVGIYKNGKIDLAKWDAALYGTQLLKQSSLDTIWTVAKLKSGQPNTHHYGFAWDVDSINGIA